MPSRSPTWSSASCSEREGDMSPLIYAVLAIVAVGAAGFALVPALFGSSRAEKRIKALQGDMQANRRENNAVRERDARRRNVQAVLKTQTDQLVLFCLWVLLLLLFF